MSLIFWLRVFIRYFTLPSSISVFYFKAIQGRMRGKSSIIISDVSGCLYFIITYEEKSANLILIIPYAFFMNHLSYNRLLTCYNILWLKSAYGSAAFGGFGTAMDAWFVNKVWPLPYVNGWL